MRVLLRSFHLTFAGDCEAAFAFYERCLGGTIVTMLLDIDDPSDAERIVHSLVQMPMQETFWDTRFGVLIDRFGIPWEINCGRPVSTS